MKLAAVLAGMLAGSLLILSGCGAGAASKPETKKTELMISAAASLNDCLSELKTIYEAKTSDVKLVFNFGASGALQQQIEQGAPADIFFSAGKKQMTALSDAGLMDTETVKDILENKVVLIANKESAKDLTFETLTDVSKIGVGEPESVPVGQYTQEIFENLGLNGKLAEGQQIYAKDVREVLAWVETGNVEAGIVYETDAKISGKVKICCAAPEGSHKPVVYPVGVTKKTASPGRALQFVEFLFSAEAKAVFEKYGFTALA